MEMGRVFEELIRIGAEQANEEAGEHFTPREVIRLMVNLLLNPEEDLHKSHVVKTIYDPACGTGGMLSAAEEYIRALNDQAMPRLYGQDWNDEAYAVCRADMLNNKADFILEYNENCGNTLKRDDVDWTQSRVIFVSQAFTPYQKEAINFKDLPISLWEIKRYSNQTISFEEIHKLNATESIKTVSTANSAVDTVSKEVIVYTENDRLKDIPEEVLDLYGQLREKILELGNVEIKATKLYVAFTVNGSNFTDITLQKKGLKLWLNLFKGELEDPYKLARDVANIGHHGNGDYELTITNTDKLDYIATLIKQAYRQKA